MTACQEVSKESWLPYRHYERGVKIRGTFINHCTELLLCKFGWIVIAILQWDPDWNHCSVTLTTIVYGLYESRGKG